MIRLHHLSACAVLAGTAACAPVNPSPSAVLGSWKAEWTCGVEALELKPDGTYVYAVDFAEGGRATDTGRWRIEAKTERLSGAHVVLEKALETCSTFGKKLGGQARNDRALETIWEWGRTILSFNPDIEGFTRVSR